MDTYEDVWRPLPDNHPIWAPDGSVIRMVALGVRESDYSDPLADRQNWVRLDSSTIEWFTMDPDLAPDDATPSPIAAVWTAGYQAGRLSGLRTLRISQLRTLRSYSWVLAVLALGDAILAVIDKPQWWVNAAIAGGAGIALAIATTWKIKKQGDPK